MSAVVTTRQGTVRGSVAGGVVTFKGIPYAAAPFGECRFLPPQPAAPWGGVHDAFEFGPEPLQLRPDPQTQAFVPDPAVFGEDCLNLNIWSPDLGAAKRPVMVWIPGGMFEVGTGASYDGSRFARDGVVCVTINYRVGTDGFLYFGDGAANLGLLDQVAALTWVRDNIAAFGGDPSNVTVFGESAGAMSIGTLLSMPRARGLFRRAILQSGAAHHVMSSATARRFGQRLAELLGVEPTRDAIATVSLESLLAAQAELKAQLLAHPDPQLRGEEVMSGLLPWQPVIDGEVIPAPPIKRIAAGAAADIDLIVGTNTEDWRLFTFFNGLLDRTTDRTLAGSIAEHGYQALAAYGLAPARALTAYRAAYPNFSPGMLLGAVQTDWWVRLPAIRLADAQAASGALTYMYEFAWPTPAFGGALGACHGLEIPFVFDTLDRGANQMLGRLLGPTPPQSLADAMHRAWIAFATDGDCGWPKYDLDRRTTMRFDATSKLIDDPRAMERALWAGLREPMSDHVAAS